MRYLLPLLFVACGLPPSPTDCLVIGCPSAKWCNPNTGVCLVRPDAGMGHGGGAGGGTVTAGAGGGAGGGQSSIGGGSGGGGASASIRVQLAWDSFSCNPNTCEDCNAFTVSATQNTYDVPFNTYTSWKTGRYAGCQFPGLSAEVYTIDCTGNCHEMTEQCTTPDGDVERKKYSCAYPDGVSGYVWTP